MKFFFMALLMHFTILLMAAINAENAVNAFANLVWLVLVMKLWPRESA